jgi:RNA polymerase sigma-70 factor (ECF subfamily)
MSANLTMTGTDNTRLLSDEPTIELLGRARAGDAAAVEALLQRCLPSLKRWAHGRLPDFVRGSVDTGDLVQEAALRAIRNLDTFEPRHVGAMQAYLRKSVTNRIIDEVRRVNRQPVQVELDEDQPGQDSSPLEVAIGAETYERYRAAVARLKSRHRAIVVARIEMQWSVDQITERFAFPSVNAARVAITRSLRQLAVHMEATSASIT